MRAPLSWLRDLVAIPVGETGRDVATRLIRAGLEVETVETVGGGVEGPLTVGRVLEIEELAEFKKPIRWCQVELGDGVVNGIICGARNFVAGDLVVVATPGTVLPGGFEITARQTYGKVSNGMICSERELGLGEDHTGIMVLPVGSAGPGDDAAALIGIGDEVLDIAITPDRGYALSIRGIAREVAIAYGVPFEDPGMALVELPAPDADRAPQDCGTEDPTGCDLFTMRTIVGFDPGAPSPLWIQRRLVACGMRPVSLAVDVTNYVMLELGQPLHAYDMDKLRGAVRADRAVDGEPFESLDHVKRVLSTDDLVIRDDTGVIGLAGVIGGLHSEIDDATTNIALEAAHFVPEVIARAGRRHKVSSEAGRRNERGVDRDLAPYASARAAALLLEFGGGHYVGMTAVEAGAAIVTIDLPASEPGDVAGLVIPRETVVSLLEAIGCEVEGEHDLRVTPPSWRPDLTDPIDLVEEVIRLHGYDRLPSTLPAAPLGRGLTREQRMRRRVGTVLAARGLVEVLTYPFVGETELDGLLLPADDRRRRTPRLANPLSEEQPLLRGTLLPGLIAVARRNASRGATDLAVFEIGSVFLGEVGESSPPRPPVHRRPSTTEWAELNALLPHQPSEVAALFTGQAEAAGWWGAGREASWADAIEAAVVIADACGVPLEVRQGFDAPFHPGRVAELSVDGAVVGAAGELHPRVVEAHGLAPRTAALWLDLDAVMAAAPEVREAPAVGTHPLAKEDLAVVVAKEVPAAAVQRALAEGAGDLLESIRLFDVYEGSPVPEGSKSLAFALRFRAPDRTLDAAETADAREAALARAAATVGATLR
ncbi:MAG: phenylalanine--tRNA ligase subunit beta [Actinomycetales bacterium]|nr:phenylalanine--tRNA ligase subunit beta [Actinomycetales bacterium]